MGRFQFIILLGNLDQLVMFATIDLCTLLGYYQVVIASICFQDNIGGNTKVLVFITVKSWDLRSYFSLL